MTEDTDMGDIAPLGQVVGHRVRLDHFIFSLIELVPLLVDGKLVTRVRELLQRAAGKVRCVNEEVPSCGLGFGVRINNRQKQLAPYSGCHGCTG